MSVITSKKIIIPVRDAIFAAASQAALGPRKEPAGLLPGSDDRPADVLLPFWANGKDAALDISVVNPLQQELFRKVARDGDSGVQHSFNTVPRWESTATGARQRVLSSFLSLWTLLVGGTRNRWRWSPSLGGRSAGRLGRRRRRS